jgi:hypothetical protein
MSDTKQILKGLTVFFGEDQAASIVDACMGQLGLEEIQTPQESLALAEVLCNYGGAVEVIGRSLKAKSIIRGARVGETFQLENAKAEERLARYLGDSEAKFVLNVCRERIGLESRGDWSCA